MLNALEVFFSNNQRRNNPVQNRYAPVLAYRIVEGIVAGEAPHAWHLKLSRDKTLKRNLIDEAIKDWWVIRIGGDGQIDVYRYRSTGLQSRNHGAFNRD